MGTKIEIWSPMKKIDDLFCRENSIKTLKKLVNNYNVMGFNSINLNTYHRGNKNNLYLFRIKKFNDEQLMPINNLEEIDFSGFGQISRTKKEKIYLIRRFGEKHLIKTPTEDYFKTRTKKIDEEKEENLNDILTYTNALLNENFTFFDLQDIMASTSPSR